MLIAMDLSLLAFVGEQKDVVLGFPQMQDGLGATGYSV
jgi:hypothetical protein